MQIMFVTCTHFRVIIFLYLTYPSGCSIKDGQETHWAILLNWYNCLSNVKTCLHWHYCKVKYIYVCINVYVYTHCLCVYIFTKFNISKILSLHSLKWTFNNSRTQLFKRYAISACDYEKNSTANMKKLHWRSQFKLKWVISTEIGLTTSDF